jgi:hypothetical protein
MQLQVARERRRPRVGREEPQAPLFRSLLERGASVDAVEDQRLAAYGAVAVLDPALERRAGDLAVERPVLKEQANGEHRPSQS